MASWARAASPLRSTWRGLEHVEYATLEWVAWYNTQRLMEPLGYLPPAEYEAQNHTSLSYLAELVLKENSLLASRGDSKTRGMGYVEMGATRSKTSYILAVGVSIGAVTSRQQTVLAETWTFPLNLNIHFRGGVCAREN